MKYTVTVLVKTKLPLLGEVLLDYENLDKWQPNFSHFEDVEGESGKPGSLKKLIYYHNKQRIVMDEYLEANNLPYSLVMIYHMDGVTNRCEHYFEEGLDGVLWRMDVTFDFVVPVSLSIENFRASTYNTMMLLKNYVESQFPIH